MKYMYTNKMLADALELSGSDIDWEYYGSSMPKMSKAVTEGFQQPDENGDIVTWMPIIDEVAFDSALGNSLHIKDSDGKFLLLVDESEAKSERDRLNTYNETKRIEDAKNAPMSDSEKLDLLIEAQADTLLGGI